MNEQQNAPTTIEEKAGILNMGIRIDPPTEEDKYSGYVVIKGESNPIKQLLVLVAMEGGRYEGGYSKMNITKELNKFGDHGSSTIDIEVKNQESETRSIRVITTNIIDGIQELSFGGGGNLTTLEETRVAVEKAIDKLITDGQAK